MFEAIRIVCRTCKVVLSIRVGSWDFVQKGIDGTLNTECAHRHTAVVHYNSDQRCVEFLFLVEKK